MLIYMKKTAFDGIVRVQFLTFVKTESMILPIAFAKAKSREIFLGFSRPRKGFVIDTQGRV